MRTRKRNYSNTEKSPNNQQPPTKVWRLSNKKRNPNNSTQPVMHDPALYAGLLERCFTQETNRTALGSNTESSGYSIAQNRNASRARTGVQLADYSSDIQARLTRLCVDLSIKHPERFDSNKLTQFTRYAMDNPLAVQVFMMLPHEMLLDSIDTLNMTCYDPNGPARNVVPAKDVGDAQNAG